MLLLLGYVVTFVPSEEGLSLRLVLHTGCSKYLVIPPLFAIAATAINLSHRS
jgi:hypothetical protein